ncbi:MAG TPA: hypothetical protein PKH06_03035, partial [Candidatus Dojkabacteria bacterium]|nr:hypothetical protein [Candidatus Dojkabacteria bacterium]
GGGGEDGFAYYDEGTYLSTPFDSESSTSEYYMFDIKTTIPEDTSVEIQIRASNNPTMSGATWCGPDGTDTTYYSSTGSYSIPPNITGRYFQYKVVFTSTSIEESALLEELVVNYEK